MWGWGKGGADSEEGGSSRGRRALTRVAHTRLPVLGGGGGHLRMMRCYNDLGQMETKE